MRCRRARAMRPSTRFERVDSELRPGASRNAARLHGVALRGGVSEPRARLATLGAVC